MKPEGSTTGAPGRVILALGVILALPLQVASALDRMADDALGPRPELPELFYGANSNAVAAEKSLQKGNLENAASYAVKAMELESVNQRAIRVLGLIAERKGDHSRSLILMRAAAALGWRDILTQLFWVDKSARAGDVSILARNLDAIYRRKGLVESLRPLTVGLEARADGRSALAERLVVPSLWRDDYVRKVDDLSTELLHNRQLLLSEVTDRGWRISPKDIAPMVFQYLKLGKPAEARATWARITDRATDNYIANSGFETPIDPDLELPFQWKLSVSGGLSVSVEKVGSEEANHALRIASDNSLRTDVAAQTLTLTPGTYEMQFRLLERQNSQASDLSANLWCQASGERIDLLTAESAERSSAFAFRPFSIQTGCGGSQKLLLRFTGNRGFEQHVLVIDDVRIRSASSS